MTLKFDWSHYIGVQMDWADALKVHAADIKGYDPDFLARKHREILADLNGRFRREVSDIVLLRRLERRHRIRKRANGPNRAVEIPDREAI